MKDNHIEVAEMIREVEEVEVTAEDEVEEVSCPLIYQHLLLPSRTSKG